MEDDWHKPETSKAFNRRSSGPIFEGIATMVTSAVAGGVLAIPACTIIPQYAPRSEQIGLWAAYAILALARKTHKKNSKAASVYCKFLLLNKLNLTKRTPLQ